MLECYVTHITPANVVTYVTHASLVTHVTFEGHMTNAIVKCLFYVPVLLNSAKVTDIYVHIINSPNLITSQAPAQVNLTTK